MHVTIVMKIMERCGVSVTKSVHVVIGRSLTPKSCFKRVFYVFHTNFTHSPCIPHISENTYTCTTHFVMFAKINFFYVPNILILSRLTNLRVFTNILYDSKERNIINNPHLSVWLNFFVSQWRRLLAAGWNITHRSGNYSSSPTCKHGMTYISYRSPKLATTSSARPGEMIYGHLLQHPSVGFHRGIPVSSSFLKVNSVSVISVLLLNNNNYMNI